MNFEVGQKVKYYKGFHGYLNVTITGITDDKIIVSDGETFDLNGIKRFSALKEYKLEEDK